MTIEEYAARQSAYARQEGLEEGTAKGRAEGLQEGRLEKETQTIKGLVSLNLTQDQIVAFLVQNFKLSNQEAQAACEKALATI
ncbi:MAG: hypothetical protein MR028_04365 [Ligilactobacillus agilis]|uniref:hypothetical protein n=1 Tax=Ligilactobacillus agilis TaxID=1601 RepID=UPI00242C32DD|nr:hypothetical protein [Ligilactobacillus agilis]MCI5761646.1 hypothetical protein [Ligilactobacillus agilis]